MTLDTVRIQTCIDRFQKAQGLPDLQVSLGFSGQDDIHSFAGCAGATSGDPDAGYFLASATKLFASAMIFQLRDEGHLSLDDPITAFFPEGALDGLHFYKGQDYTAQITVRQLLSHRAGLADYFEQKRVDGSVFAEGMLQGQDKAWSLEDVIDANKTSLTPLFPPGAAGKASYTDTGFQLLGGIIKAVTGQDEATVVQTRIAGPLGLTSTGLFRRDGSTVPALPLRMNKAPLSIPAALESTRLDGGGYSTSAEMLRFLKAFYEGALFDIARVMQVQEYRRIFFPLRNGTGMMMFHTPWYFSPFKRQPDLLGHSGISGAFAYHAPSTGLYISGTTNELAKRSLPYQLMIRLMSLL
ncbi:CubicO group peptidase, beta-lactamase class C family [Aliiroseovarius halocynthiae]|nr:serine hydrolase domain-containing protein [Aliiroseovarius halocynthiae]SMR82378.1 CubicO group peptidase, beta-lactamase class C family [Aliiroseovarius halocynthiae]